MSLKMWCKMSMEFWNYCKNYFFLSQNIHIIITKCEKINKKKKKLTWVNGDAIFVCSSWYCFRNFLLSWHICTIRSPHKISKCSAFERINFDCCSISSMNFFHAWKVWLPTNVVVFFYRINRLRWMMQVGYGKEEEKIILLCIFWKVMHDQLD